ncbi:MAG TPA: hypothetical protein VI731_06410, partial [Bacteroidia bacterium]|nr:hypothetical protein [Bacteroidia bacterium]
KHPIVRNLDRIKFDFISTIDTVETGPGVKKTILIRSSDKSRYVRAGLGISLRMAMIKRPPSSFNKPFLPVAVLLEGNFDSYYKGKFLPPELKESKSIGYREKSKKPSKIIVVADGDVARNPVNQGKPLPLGYDLLNRLNQEFYANKTFLLNSVNYLCDDKGLLELRSREVTLRLLNRSEIKEHRLKWQLINTVGPIVFLAAFGFISIWTRNRKYVKGIPLHPAILIALAFVPAIMVHFLIKDWSITIGFTLATLLAIGIHYWFSARR